MNQDDEFILDGDAPKGKRRNEIKPKRKKQTPEDKLKSKTVSVRLEGFYEIEFRKKFGFPLIVREARDRKILNDFEEQWGEKAVKATMVGYLTSTDPQVRRSRFYNIPDFAYWAERVRMQAATGGDLHERTASNANEVLKAMGRGRRVASNDED